MYISLQHKPFISLINQVLEKFRQIYPEYILDNGIFDLKQMSKQICVDAETVLFNIYKSDYVKGRDIRKGQLFEKVIKTIGVKAKSVEKRDDFISFRADTLGSILQGAEMFSQNQSQKFDITTQTTTKKATVLCLFVGYLHWDEFLKVLKEEELKGIQKNTPQKKEDELNDKIQSSSIDFTDFINERTENFVGRKNVSDLFFEFQNKHKSGYYILSGKPGMGKSAYLASLVKKYGYVHHFINSDKDGKNSINDVLRNLIYSLNEKYHLNLGNLIETNISDGTFIKRVFNAISEKLNSDEKCVIIIDAVDELKKFDSIKKESNIFHFPRILPNGLYFILSIRERKDLPLKAMIEKSFELHPDSPENESDIREYINVFIDKEGIKGFMTKNSLSEIEFEDLLNQKSEGNFMYLHCVLPQIEEGYYHDVEFNQIPNGLESYYEDHWERMKGKDEKTWYEYKLPIISMITLSEMSLSLEMIREYAKLPKTAMVLAVLEDWRQFFFEKTVGPDFLNIKLYKLYHRTFKDFLKRKAQVQAEQIDIRRFAKDFILKYQELYSPKSQMEDFLKFHNNLKGDIRAE